MQRLEPKRNLIQIQDAYVSAVEAAYSRWSHRPGIKGIADGVGGHYGRRVHAARQTAIASLQQWGFSHPEAAQLVRDAHEVALLQRHAADETVDLGALAAKAIAAAQVTPVALEEGWLPAGREVEFSPERYDFVWNDDYSAFRAVPLRWHDDASYLRYQGEDRYAAGVEVDDDQQHARDEQQALLGHDEDRYERERKERLWQAAQPAEIPGGDDEFLF